MSMNITETDVIDEQIDQTVEESLREYAVEVLLRKYALAKEELANFFTLNEALFIVFVCSEDKRMPICVSEDERLALHDEIDWTSLWDERAFFPKMDSLTVFQTFSVVLMARECLNAFGDDEGFRIETWIEELVKPIFGIEKVTSN
ncbi:hypothetical protein [Alicyclobacillus mengziensis]|uniref:Uncharacterized protein n=1 Tax=Alicyclobacillus mengziensis TaxID=2931921 RepID=A0A9X7Z704_9BACL|nr:hypothetical protein [Alicyclobacillus mengziensis]QSO48499.1 hypothetical protein JZ786_05790 [Alicyclobacillus mengziensis]